MDDDDLLKLSDEDLVEELANASAILIAGVVEDSRRFERQLSISLDQIEYNRKREEKRLECVKLAKDEILRRLKERSGTQVIKE